MTSWPRSFVRALSSLALLSLGACSHSVTNDDSSPDGAFPPEDDASIDAPATTPPTGSDDASAADDATVPPAGDDDSGADGATDDAATGPVDVAPSPALASIAPASAIVGTPGPTIVCTGSGFVSRSVVQVNGVALSTGFVSATELRATLPDADLASLGSLHVTVGTAPPGGGGSAEQLFQVVNPAPTLTSLAPTSALLGAASALLTVTGTSFVTGVSVSFNGAALPTTLTSATTATVTLPASLLAVSGSFPVTVSNPAPGGGTSSSIAFIVSNPTVTVSSVKPSSLLVGAGATSIALVGTGFEAATAVSFNGATIASTFTDAAHMTATVPQSALANVGSFPVVVTNPAPGGGVSTPVQVAVVYPVPTLTSLSPTNVQVGAAPATVTVVGSGFVAGATSILFDGSSALTTVVDATHASATLTTAQMSPAHVIAVTVSNPSPGGGAAGPLSFTVQDPLPVATSVTPSAALVGAGDTLVTLTGAGFVPASTILLGATPLATTYLGATSLTATIPASDLQAAVTLSLAANNPAPGGGTSGDLSFVVDNPGPAITSIAPTSTVIPAAATPITVSGSGFVPGVSILNLGGAPLATTYPDGGALGATIPASSLAVAQTLSITVVNPSPGGGTSNASFFTADDPAPTLALLSPASAFAGASATQVTLTGTGFVAASAVQINGTTATSTLNSSTSITVTLPASQLETPTSLTFSVVNPAPGGGTSGTQTFSVACNTTGVDVALTALNQTSTETLNLASSTTTAYRITTSQAFGSNPDTCPAQKEDTSAVEPYRGYLVMNATSQAATLEAWAVCSGSEQEDAYLTFYTPSPPAIPTTQAGLESCTGVIAEGANGSGGFTSKSPGSSSFCPGLTKANGQGLSLPACGVAVVLVQAWTTTNTKYPPPPTLAVDLE